MAATLAVTCPAVSTPELLIVAAVEFSLQLAKLVTTCVLLSLKRAVAEQLPEVPSLSVAGHDTAKLLRALAGAGVLK